MYLGCPDRSGEAGCRACRDVRSLSSRTWNVWGRLLPVHKSRYMRMFSAQQSQLLARCKYQVDFGLKKQHTAGRVMSGYLAHHQKMVYRAAAAAIHHLW